MNEDRKIEYLKSIELFSSLSPDELRQVSNKIAVRQFKKNEIILYEEDTNEYMYIIFEGEVKVVQTTEEGKEVVLAIHRSGDFFGDMSLIDGKTIPATVVTTKDSITAIISKSVFYVLISSHNKILERMLEILSSRLRQSWKLIQMLNFTRAPQRIKMLLAMLAEKYGSEINEEMILDIRLTHQGIADMTGLTRETVTRVIDKWLKSGDIAILKDKAIRLNPGFLQRYY